MIDWQFVELAATKTATLPLADIEKLVLELPNVLPPHAERDDSHRMVAIAMERAYTIAYRPLIADLTCDALADSMRHHVTPDSVYLSEIDGLKCRAITQELDARHNSDAELLANPGEPLPGEHYADTLRREYAAFAPCGNHA